MKMSSIVIIGRRQKAALRADGSVHSLRLDRETFEKNWSKIEEILKRDIISDLDKKYLMRHDVIEIKTAIRVEGLEIDDDN